MAAPRPSMAAHICRRVAVVTRREKIALLVFVALGLIFVGVLIAGLPAAYN